MKHPKLVLELLRPSEDLLSFVEGLCGGCSRVEDLRTPELVLRVSPCVLRTTVLTGALS